MATLKIFGSRANYIYPAAEMTNEGKESNGQDVFEFDESDVWDDATDRHFPEKIETPSSVLTKKSSEVTDPETEPRHRRTISSSLPVNIPDWSKILKEEHRRTEIESDTEDDDGIGDGELSGGRIRDPPHEYLAKRRGDSLSVHEGVGRTLKGRDLRRVRDAILKQLID